MSGIGNALNAFPAQPGPNMHPGNVAGFLTDLLGGISQYNTHKRQSELEQAQVSEVQRNAAKQQLDQLTNIFKSNPDKRTDPKLIEQAKQLSKTAGLPDPSTQTSGFAGGNLNSNADGAGITGKFKGTDFGTPQLQKETVDMNILAPKPDIGSVDEKEREWLASLDPVARKPQLDRYSGVEPEMYNAPATTSPKDRNQIITDVNKVVTQVGKGELQGPAAAAELRFISGEAAKVGMPVDELVSMIQQNAAVGPETAAKMAQLQQLGIGEKSMAQYHQMLTVDRPKWMAEQLRQGQQKADAATTNAGANVTKAGAAVTSADASTLRAQTAQSVAQQNVDAASLRAQADMERADASVTQADAALERNDINAQKATLVQQNTTLAGLNREYSTVMSNIRTIIANSGDPMEPGPDGKPSIADQAAKIKASIDQLTGSKTKLKINVTRRPTTHIQQATGNPTAKVGGDQFKPGMVVPGNQGYRFTDGKFDQSLKGYKVVGPDGRVQLYQP